MKIPNLPTDNLYKFLAIFGLILFIFGFHMSKEYPNELQLKINNLNSKFEILDNNKKNDSINGVISKESKEKEIELKFKKEELQNEIKKFPNYFYLYMTIWVFGIIIMVIGFYKWYFKTQIFSDIILKNESKKSEINKEISVYKLQFDKEFIIYQELWETLIDVRNKRTFIKTSVLMEFPNELNENLIKFIDSLNVCINIFEKNKPFYSNEIYIELQKIMLILSKELIDYKNDEKLKESYWWIETEKNINKIIEITDTICDKIRKRIGTL